jgi:hypothetical protein
MSLRWLPVRPIDWQEVHWAGGESDDAIRLRPEGDGVARCAHRGPSFKLTVFQNYDVHKQVERAGCLRRGLRHLRFRRPMPLLPHSMSSR